MARVADGGGQITAGQLTGGWRWVLASGVLLAIAGLAAFVAPSLTAVTASFFIGWLLLLVGIAGVVTGMGTRRHHGRWSDLLYGVLSILVAVYILFNPLAGAISLTLALGIWFAIRGGIELGGAVRAGAGKGRRVLIVIGVMDLLLALLLLGNFPYPAVQVVGLFLGISLLMAGAVTIATALQLRRIAGV